MTKFCEHIDDIETYEPAGHGGTVNRRLISRDEGQNYEMVLGRIAPGGVADRHNHAHAYQAMYVISGQATVSLGGEVARQHGPGTMFRIPPGLDHEVTNNGTQTLELMLVYSPPINRDHTS